MRHLKNILRIPCIILILIYWYFRGTIIFIQVVRTELGTAEEKNALPGTVLCIERERGILVKCKEGSLWLCEVHPAGKKPMPALAFANGRNLKPGDDVFKE